MIAIIDYGAGNLFSVKNALDYLDIDAIITSNKQEIEKSSGIILPGVGAFPDAMKMINEHGLNDVLFTQAKSGKPFLGVCLGMQLLFEKGYEFEETKGLGLIPGFVEKMSGDNLKIPHMGWNDLVINSENALTKGVSQGDRVYFVHSYKAVTSMDNISLYTNYGGVVPAIVNKGNVYGAQFHPEKSGTIGLNILNNFCNLCK